MSQATNRLWRKPPNQLEQLRDVGTVDINTQVTVHAGRDERQTPTVLLTLTTTSWRTLTRVLNRGQLGDLGDVTIRPGGWTLTLTLDDCSTLAALLDDDGNWSDTVTALRQAMGLAACWVDFQDGVA